MPKAMQSLLVFLSALQKGTNLMKWLKALCLLIAALITSALSLCWRTLLFLVDLIDGGDDENDHVPTDSIIHYNHRSGEIDPVKRVDGLYDNKL